jgi:alpha-D-xyloside xylohydrolase
MPALALSPSPTRKLETRAVARICFGQGHVSRCTAGVLELKVSGQPERPLKLSSADQALLSGLPTLLSDQAPDSARWRLEIIEAGLLRLRVAKGRFLTGAKSPMLDAIPSPRGRFRWRVKDQVASCCAGAHQIRVRLADLRVTISDRASGRTVCAWGGPEKNRFRPWASAPTGISHTLEQNRPIAHEAFDLATDEAIWGFGEAFGALDHHGRTLDLDLNDALGVNTQRFYKPVPFWLSSRGCGVFLHQAARVTAWVGSLSTHDLQVAVDDDHLDFFVFLGPPRSVLSRYTRLTGRAEPPPAWSFGLIQGKCSYQSAAEVDAVVARYAALKIKLGAIHLDTHWFGTNWLCDLEFDPHRFPQPRRWLASLKDAGVRVGLWQLPYLPEGTTLFDEMAAADGFVKTADGSLYDVGICYVKGFTGRVGIIDYTHPAARRIHARWLRRCLRLGADFIKTDFGEDAPIDGVYHDGTPGHRMHNLYPLLYNRVVAEATRAARGHAFVWARSAWAGGQRFPAHWGGDPSANFDALAATLCGGLSLGLSGFAYWSHDVGGFLGRPDARLFLRWLQVALLGSHLRLHAAGRDCEIDRWGPEATAIARSLLELRERLLPWLTATAATGAAEGLPLLRALPLSFPSDRNVWRIADQFMVGDALLAAPVITDLDTREVYFPVGRWTCCWTGRPTVGPSWHTVRTPLERLPLWWREGHAPASLVKKITSFA